MDSSINELCSSPLVYVVGVLYLCLFFTGTVVTVLKYIEYKRHPFNPAPLTTRLRRRAWNGTEIRNLFGLYFLLYLLVMLNGSFLSKQVPLIQACITVIIWTIVFFTITVTNRRRDETWASTYGLGFKKIHRLYQSAPYYITSIAPVLFSSWIYSTMLRSVGIEENLQTPVKMMMESPPLFRALLIGLATIGAPLFEEVLFRGVLFPYLLTKMPVTYAGILTSAVFAAAHFNIGSFIPIFVLSIALCFAYWRTGSLWVSIGMHALFNTISTLAILLLAS